MSSFVESGPAGNVFTGGIVQSKMVLNPGLPMLSVAELRLTDLAAVVTPEPPLPDHPTRPIQ